MWAAAAGRFFPLLVEAFRPDDGGALRSSATFCCCCCCFFCASTAAIRADVRRCGGVRLVVVVENVARPLRGAASILLLILLLLLALALVVLKSGNSGSPGTVSLGYVPCVAVMVVVVVAGGTYRRAAAAAANVVGEEDCCGCNHGCAGIASSSTCSINVTLLAVSKLWVRRVRRLVGLE